MKLFRFLKNVWKELWNQFICQMIIGIVGTFSVLFIAGLLYRVTGLPIPTPRVATGYFSETIGLGAITFAILAVIGGVIFGVIAAFIKGKQIWKRS